VRVLQISHKPPYPVIDGGCLAINQISQSLIQEGIDLTVRSIATQKHPFRKETFPDGYLSSTSFKAVFADTTPNVIDALSNLITQDSYHISRFFSVDFDRELVRLLKNQKFDIVILESIFVGTYISTIRRLSKAAIVLRSHNLEFSIWHRLARAQKSLLRRSYLRILTSQLKDFEVNLLQDIDALIAINQDELKYYRRLGYTSPGITIPFGVSTVKYHPSHSEIEWNSVFHLGSMDWQPNVEGVEWFLTEVWPMVHKAIPEARFYIAGRNISERFEQIEIPGVVVCGEVPDAQAFMKSKNVMIVPLRSGGGMRVKLIEGLALEKPTVSTPLGARGIAVADGLNCLIARKPEEFAEAIVRLLSDRVLAMQIGKEGRKLVGQHYDKDQLSSILVNFLKNLGS